jgi:TPR repeat protein
MVDIKTWSGNLDNVPEWVERADKGDPEAQYHTAHYMLHNIELGEHDAEIVKRAIDYLRSSAMSGYFHGIAATELGELYFAGKHVPQDFAKAVMWYRNAAQNQNPIGYYHLGKCFSRGYGIKQDYAKAFDAFFKGAMINYAKSTIMLGDMIKDGLFGKPDPQYAVRLYRYAFNDAVSIYEENKFWSDTYWYAGVRLGECYLRGHGVPKNIKEANRYFAEAKKHDDEYWRNREKPALIDLMYAAPYPADEETTAVDAEIGAASFLDTEFSAESIPSDNLEAYFFIVKYLLLNRKKSGEPYKRLSELYPQLPCFESDPLFVEFCHRASKKYAKNEEEAAIR